MNLELLTRSSVNVVETFSASSSFAGFIAATNFGPAFFHDLNPKLTCPVLVDFSAILVLNDFSLGKTKLFNPLFIDIKWKPVINHNLSWFSVNMVLYTVDTSFIE
jgi:hypothetical protein